jgi:hypothetical protein
MEEELVLFLQYHEQGSTHEEWGFGARVLGLVFHLTHDVFNGFK